ncbi:hypothetical protein AB0F17_59720 [Nonomuraea sp. NPDC026600]|uniref:hypothetical protein n=1 Tax=Nonomuraea sp. NPDC026600 TaxID=3155363 RepID=UPI0033E8FC10
MTRDDTPAMTAAYDELLAVARATVAAAALGEPEPLAILAGYLAEHAQLPPVGARPAQLLALASSGWGGGGR